jgi:hypothetical protein
VHDGVRRSNLEQGLVKFRQRQAREFRESAKKPGATIGTPIATLSGMCLLTCSGVLAVVALADGRTSASEEPAGPQALVDAGRDLEEQRFAITPTGSLDGCPKAPENVAEPRPQLRPAA